jgi:hypothetical protein
MGDTVQNDESNLQNQLGLVIERVTEVDGQDQGGGIPPPISLGNKSV